MNTGYDRLSLSSEGGFMECLDNIKAELSSGKSITYVNNRKKFYGCGQRLERRVKI